MLSTKAEAVSESEGITFEQVGSFFFHIFSEREDFYDGSKLKKSEQNL